MRPPATVLGVRPISDATADGHPLFASEAASGQRHCSTSWRNSAPNLSKFGWLVIRSEATRAIRRLARIPKRSEGRKANARDTAWISVFVSCRYGNVA